MLRGRILNYDTNFNTFILVYSNFSFKSTDKYSLLKYIEETFFQGISKANVANIS